MTNDKSDRTGLLLATMEPPACMEDEFQHWYDSEHFPERKNADGFLTATRGVCLDGWPRYIAMYDLEDPGVLQRPGYRKIAGDNYSRWTDRIMSRVWGQYRAAAAQVYPGKALMGQNGSASRIVLWRFSNVNAAVAGDAVNGMRTLYEAAPETAQVRVFETKQPDGADYIGIVELHAPWAPPPGQTAKLGAALRHLDMVNVYTRYQRIWGGTYPHK